VDELHEFHDYEALSELGWEFNLVAGGFARSSAFDRYLLEGDLEFLLSETSVGVIKEVTNTR